MTYRIAVIGSGFRPLGHSTPPDEILAVMGKGFDTRLVEIADGVFPADEASRAKCDVQYLEAGLAAQAAGFDGVYINTAGDYGLSEMRQELTIPVVGSGETAMGFAAARGRFSIVTIWPPSLAFLYQRVIHRCGTASMLAGITHLSADHELACLADDENFVTDMRSCALTSMAAVEQARDDAAKQQGVASVVLGCTCMAPMAARLAPHSEVMTVDPMTLGYRFTEHCLTRGLLPQDANFGAFSGS